MFISSSHISLSLQATASAYLNAAMKNPYLSFGVSFAYGGGGSLTLPLNLVQVSREQQKKGFCF